jgi:hypothetical protein
MSWTAGYNSYIVCNIAFDMIAYHFRFFFALRIRIAAFCYRVQAAFCIAMFLMQCIAHKSSPGRFGRSRRCIWKGGGGSSSHAPGAGCSAGSLTILVLFRVIV